MNDLKEQMKSEKEKSSGGGLFSGLRSLVGGERSTSGERRALTQDLIFFAIGLLFARCHVVFGARPLGLGYVAVLPSGVLPAAIGVVTGALTLGKEGIIYALVSVIAVFLRVIISGGKEGEGRLFGENLLLRMSSATIAGFVGAVYEILLSGFSYTSILFGLSMVLLSPLVTFAFSGLFSTGFSTEQLLYATGNIFSLSKKRDKEKYNAIFFQVSALLTLFLLTLSLGEFEILGISAAYIFVSFVTLLVARRFGALRALAVGFFSSLGICGVFSVSFALAGLGAGALFSLGLGYGLIGGFAALSAWSAYSAGLTGFLSTLPEFLIAASLAFPILKWLSAERSGEDTAGVEQSAAEMVGTMALTYRSRYSAGLDALEAALSDLGTVMLGRTETRLALSEAEYTAIISDVARRACRSCPELSLCEAQGIDPCNKNAPMLAALLCEGGTPTAADVNTDTEFCHRAESIAKELCEAAAEAERESFRRCDGECAEEYGLISKLIGEARALDDAERSLNAALSEKLTEAIENIGYRDWVIKAFGERRSHVILAGEDKSGDRITSPALRAAIEERAGMKMTSGEFFRRESMALMECDATRSYTVECATATAPGDRTEPSGDSVTVFETSGDYFYALLSDGMGRGKVAERTSGFVCRFLTRALDFGASRDTVLHLLNRALRKGREECSATVDLFEFDLLTGEATFIKSGSAPSFVKRGGSIFRIRSQTAPIGLMSTIDTERIKVEVKADDLIIMLSDGVSQSADDTPWLLELLSSQRKRYTPRELADLILKEAIKNNDSGDDMSVIVLKISAL